MTALLFHALLLVCSGSVKVIARGRTDGEQAFELSWRRPLGRLALTEAVSLLVVYSSKICPLGLEIDLAGISFSGPKSRLKNAAGLLGQSRYL